MDHPARSLVPGKFVRLAVPVAAVAALGLTACSNSEAASTVPGTTPPVWTGQNVPGGPASVAGGEDAAGEGVTAELQNPAGAAIGTAVFTEVEGHVQVALEVHGLEPGFHGLHIHQNAVCEPDSVAPAGGAPGNFLSAGGHWQAPGHEGHPASGDLTSLEVREDGSGELLTTTSMFDLDELTGEGGHSIIVHANADNFANIPTRYTLPDNAPVPDADTLATGDAGARVACGVIH
ncbi:MAG TPA: superoxide dismutase family protein [Aldersonia sp.]